MAVAMDPQLALSKDTALALEYDAVPRSVRQARNAIAAFAEAHGAAGEGVDDIRMAMSEATTNIVLHAYDSDRPGRFRVLAIIGGGQMLVIIDDDGRGFSAPAQHPGLGMGLDLMRKASEQALFLARDCGGSTVKLRFRLDS